MTKSAFYFSEQKILNHLILKRKACSLYLILVQNGAGGGGGLRREGKDGHKSVGEVAELTSRQEGNAVHAVLMLQSLLSFSTTHTSKYLPLTVKPTFRHLWEQHTTRGSLV